MTMTSRDMVIRTIKFQGADRLPYDLPAPYGSDFAVIGMRPSPDDRPPNGPDEWGCVWKNIGICNDWGLQSRLMISPEFWRVLWKPRYAQIYKAAHAAGLCTFLHSCGYIVDILDDLIEIGLDVIHMDQQENMGLELLGRRFGGRITFFSPVDIQKTMVRGSLDDIRRYARDMVRLLGRPKGGFIPRWYTDPKGAGHRPEALDAMSAEFIKLSRKQP